MLLPLLSALLYLPFSLAFPHRDLDDHSVRSSLPGKWYHDDDHPVHALFRRQANTDGMTYAPVGSPAWAAPYPPSYPDPTKMPQEWINALNAAEAAGKIPNITIPTLVGSNPTYPPGMANSPQVCSAYAQCRMPQDIWDAPTGVLGVGFDDGPYLGSALLYDFLQGANQRATHFMIGINILQNPALFTRAFDTLQGDIAVHTWTHRYMSTLANADLVAEFGWTMQIIHNSTGGRLPRYWRPPYGDMDNRVRAVASEIFGLTGIMWNQDTSDWSLGQPKGTNPQAINASMTQWLTGPKTPGLIILEHELTNASAQAFIDAYPLMVSQQWKLNSVMTINGTSPYINSNDAASPVQPINGIFASDALVASSSSVSPSVSHPAAAASTTVIAKPATPNGASPGFVTSRNAIFLVSGTVFLTLFA